MLVAISQAKYNLAHVRQFNICNLSLLWVSAFTYAESIQVAKAIATHTIKNAHIMHRTGPNVYEQPRRSARQFDWTA